MCYALCNRRTNRTWSDCTLSPLVLPPSPPSPGLLLLIAFAIRECAVNCCYFNAIFKWNANCLMISIGKLLEYLTSAERRATGTKSHHHRRRLSSQARDTQQWPAEATVLSASCSLRGRPLQLLCASTRRHRLDLAKRGRERKRGRDRGTEGCLHFCIHRVSD